MAQIRETIELLTRVLKNNGSSKIKAEVFRLAKFDNEDAVDPMWKLLFELIYFCKYGSIDEISIKAKTELSPDELVVFVKREMQKRGFYSRDFAGLPNDMSSGSRELLLAFGWLMCKESVIEKFMENCSSPLSDDTYSMLSPRMEKPSNQQPQPPANPLQKVQYVLWLNGKLRMNLRKLYAVQREKNKLKHSINSATLGVSLDPSSQHLSQLEVYMLKHPELLKQNLLLLERDNERLQNLLQWKDHDDVFWRWMESVLDAKLAEGNHLAKESTTPPPSLASQSLSSETVQKVTESKHQLRDAILKYESIIDHIENLWEMQSSEVTEEDLENILTSIDLEISIQRASIALNSCEDAVQPRAEPRFLLTSPATKQSKAKPYTGSEEEIKDVKAEIELLEELVDHLESDVVAKQNQYRQEMHVLSAKFDDSVLIPPMERKNFMS